MELRNQAKGAKPDISGDLDVRGVNRTKVQEPAPEPAGKPTKFKPNEDERYGTSDLPQLDLVGMAKANEPKQPAKPVTPKVETGAETPIKKGSFPHHIAMYNGKAVLIDYVGKKDRDQFVTGASRIATNGAEGYVITTKGEVFKVTQKSRRASPVTGAEREQVLADLKGLEPKSPKPDQVPDAGKMVQPAPKPDVSAKKEPWEMTREEVGIDRAVPIKDPEVKGLVWSHPGAEVTPKKKIKSYSIEDTGTNYKLWDSTGVASVLKGTYGKGVPNAFKRAIEHARKLDVESALKEGKPVPKEVLADYPDLAKKYEAPAKESPAAPKPVAKQESGKAVAGEPKAYDMRAPNGDVVKVENAKPFKASNAPKLDLYIDTRIVGSGRSKKRVTVISDARTGLQVASGGSAATAEAGLNEIIRQRGEKGILARIEEVVAKHGEVPGYSKPTTIKPLPKTPSKDIQKPATKVESVVAPERSDSAVIRKAHNIPPAKNRIPMPEEWKSEKMIPGMGLRPSQRDFLVKELNAAKERGDEIAEVKVPGDGEWKIKTGSDLFKGLLVDLGKKRIQSDSGPVKLDGGGAMSANALYKMVKASDKIAGASGQAMPRIKFLTEVGEAQLEKEGWTVSRRYSSRAEAKADVKDGGWVESIWSSTSRGGGTTDYYAINPPKELVESQAKKYEAPAKEPPAAPKPRTARRRLC